MNMKQLRLIAILEIQSEDSKKVELFLRGGSGNVNNNNIQQKYLIIHFSMCINRKKYQ